MHHHSFFIEAFVYLLAAVISVPLAKRIGLGSVLGYLLAGIIIGPYVLGVVDTGGNNVMHFAEFGVVIMLFLIGLEIRPSLLWKMRQSIFGLGGLQVAITTGAITGLVLLVGLSWNKALAIGLILALSSTAIVLQTLAERGILKSSGGQSAFSILLFQDISVIPILALLPLLVIQGTAPIEQHNGYNLVAHLDGWQQVILIILLVSGIILVGRYAARRIFRAIANTGMREIFTATALLIVVSIALAMNAVGLSPALGTFIAGVVLADSEYRHELEADIEPFKGLLLGLFFIAVGAGINFQLLADQFFLIAGLLFALMMIKSIILRTLAHFFRLAPDQGWLVTLSLAQAGEFAFVLLSFSVQSSLLDTATAELITIVVALSMALTPVLLLINEHLVQPRFANQSNVTGSDTIEVKDNPVIIAGFGRFGVIIGRLLMASGFSKITILDNDPVHINHLRKFGFKVYYGDASRHDLLETAGIAQAKLLIIAIDDPEKATQIAEYVKRKHPHVRVGVRSHDISHAYELAKLKVDHIKHEVSFSALEMGISALKDLGFTPFQAHRAAKIFRYHNQRVKKKLYKHWEGDQKRYINEVKHHAEELEEMLLREMEHKPYEADAAWDSDALREEVLQYYQDMEENSEQE